ncbi:phosphatase 2C-like domain-containing protein [Mycena alexandri]|uniref:Phosphatase 2C-like domain-containing protein n=1 Tax=Mycena alexandri TaxID=1745969 RepID=A0AAD6XE87_9AGAR|nr:phosphatase 2C-like domain-containing protein [Mycena alexandri]
MVDHLQWAYPEDLPGSRCTPEDGPWPRAYYLLDEAEIWEEFQRLADPSSLLCSAENGWRADGINFQPAPQSTTQDRYVLKQLNIHGRLWMLTGVFDGHLGEETVAHVAHHLPIIVQEFLQEFLGETDSTHQITPAFISGLFSRAIVSFDNAIAGDILNLFGGPDRLDRYSDQEIRDIINDQDKGGDNYKKARLCMYGTTALVALTDPEHENLWVANLGDCQAVLVSPKSTEEWDVEFITTEHNGDNDAEIDRVYREHPGEPECVVNRRVLGALAPFRGLGDVPFKQPPSFTRRILYNLHPGFADTAPWEICLARNLTPPYISAAAEITHRRLKPPGTDQTRRPRYLVLASDGFTELCRVSGRERVLATWAKREAAQARAPSAPAQGNLASRLLRQALGGEDRAGVSCMLTLDMDEPWVDDTAIVVQTL